MRTHQILYFKSGQIKTIFGIDGIRGGEMLHLHVEDGRTFLVNAKEINLVEVVPDEMGKRMWGAEFEVFHTNNREWVKGGEQNDERGSRSKV